jgi:hypothetical protein
MARDRSEKIERRRRIVNRLRGGLALMIVLAYGAGAVAAAITMERLAHLAPGLILTIFVLMTAPAVGQRDPGFRGLYVTCCCVFVAGLILQTLLLEGRYLVPWLVVIAAAIYASIRVCSYIYTSPEVADAFPPPVPEWERDFSWPPGMKPKRHRRWRRERDERYRLGLGAQPPETPR